MNSEESIKNALVPNIKEEKAKVISKLHDKLEMAKVNLIQTELNELSIKFDSSITSISELKQNLESTLSETDYNKSLEVIEKIEKSLNEMVDSLEKGSKSAFTRLMTGDLAKGICKTLGISLAGRTLLLLAPTISTKAAVAAGLGAYGLYKLVKNRKDIVKANEENEINKILMELETTKNEYGIVDTRFNETERNNIKVFLKENNIKFDDTGYRSLRGAIYSLDKDKKLELINKLNLELGKNIDINTRLEKARKKLNIAANTASSVRTGALLAGSAAVAVNSVDPALTAGAINGTFLGLLVEHFTDSKWFSTLAGTGGTISTFLAEHIPVVGGTFKAAFAAENLAAFSAAGITGGLVVGSTLSVASLVKGVYDAKKLKGENQKFLEIDSKKYADEDKKEYELINKNLVSSPSEVELVIIDIVLGYLKDNNINLDKSPKSLNELKDCINKLNENDKKIASNILSKIKKETENDPTFKGKLKKAGKISLGIFTAGLAAISVYDIIKSGTFIPELSKKLFPENNMYDMPPLEDINEPYNLKDKDEKNIFEEHEKRLNEMKDDKHFYTKEDGDYLEDYSYNKFDHGSKPGIDDTLDGIKEKDLSSTKDGIFRDLKDAKEYATNGFEYFSSKVNNTLGTPLDKFCENYLGVNINYDTVPDIPKITRSIDNLEPEKLYELYRTYSTIKNNDNTFYNAIGEILGYNSNLEKVSEYMVGYENTRKLYETINDISSKLANGMIPLPVGLKMLIEAQNKVITPESTNENEKVKTK